MLLASELFNNESRVQTRCPQKDYMSRNPMKTLLMALLLLLICGYRMSLTRCSAEGSRTRFMMSIAIFLLICR
jgi:hypothetical protein